MPPRPTPTSAPPRTHFRRGDKLLTASMSSILEVEQLQRSQIGYTEYPPGSNRTKYGRWYGMDGVAWCLIYQHWIFAQVGMPIPYRSAYTPSMADWFRQHGAWSSRPVRGGLAFWNFIGGANRIEHVGWIQSVSGDMITSIDGNTSQRGSQVNGGAVLQRTRRVSQGFVGCGLLGYAKGESELPRIDTSHPAFFIPLPSQGPESEWVPIALRYATKSSDKGDMYRNFQILHWDRNQPPAPSSIPRDSVAVGLNWAGWPKVAGSSGGHTMRQFLDFVGAGM